MNRFTKITSLIFFMILLDQYSKYYYFNQPDSYFIHKHFNSFFIFGAFSSGSATTEIKYILTGIIFSTVVLIFFLINFLLFSNQRIVELGLWSLFVDDYEMKSNNPFLFNNIIKINSI